MFVTANCCMFFWAGGDSSIYYFFVGCQDQKLWRPAQLCFSLDSQDKGTMSRFGGVRRQRSKSPLEATLRQGFSA